LKWPNDVEVTLSSGSPLKVAGILAETSTVLGRIDYVIVGIGVNLTDAAWPAGLISRAGSVEGLTGRSVDPAVLLVELLASFAHRCDDVESGKIADLLNAWEALAPSSRGANVEWSAGKVRHRGITEGIGEDGALLVRVGSRLERLIGGEVRQVR
jgi:BirA family biotin operon repressor/biotin-[acetyl-CoA-carboxylase] ligase